MKELWSTSIRELEAYVPGEQPQDRPYIKLNTNENPYPPSPKAVAAMQAAVGGALNRYPDPGCAAFHSAIAQTLGVPAGHVFSGNGSDEILALCFKAFFDSGKAVRFPDISYSFYPVYAALYGAPYEKVPLRADFTLDVPAFFHSAGGVLIPNPNAPTAIAAPLQAIEQIVRQNAGRVVIIDEAYIDFGGESALPLLQDYDNLLIVRTMSKGYSLAGLRAGFAIGSPDLIAALNTVKNSFNSYTLDQIAIAGAAAAMLDRGYFEQCRQRVVDTRARSAARLRTLGFTLTESSTNVLFATPPAPHAAEQLFLALRARGVLVRYFKQPRISDYLRITIGTDAEMDVFFRELEDLLRGGNP